MRQGELKVWTEEWDGAPVIGAEGEIDLSTVDALRKAASEIVRRKPEAVTFDFRRVTYIDSTGLGVLVATRRHLGNRTGSVTVVTEQPAVLHSLQLTGLDRIMRVIGEPLAARTGPGS